VLTYGDGPPVEIVNLAGRSAFVLVCDHASNRVPAALGDLGLSREELSTHIAWDIGAADVARELSRLLDAPLVLSGHSRLVIDCNRPLAAASSIAESSGGIDIPGNRGLDDPEREQRREIFFRPYHRAIEQTLDARAGLRGGAGPVLLSIHSFTPSLLGDDRPWPIALLYGSDPRLAHAFLEVLRRDGALVGDNQPYRVSDATDYTVPVHGIRRGLLHTAFEIRQDGVSERDGAVRWAGRIATATRVVAASLGIDDDALERRGTAT
jgi:predicted N-formylglutamate amidohydrolase